MLTQTVSCFLSPCCRVMEHSDSNRMTTQNIGIVFGPTLMRPQSDCANMAINMVYQNQAVELILSEYDEIFGSDPSRSLWRWCGTYTAVEPAHCELKESETHWRVAEYDPCNYSLNCNDATNSILVDEGWMNGWMEVLEQQSANWPLVGTKSHKKKTCVFKLNQEAYFMFVCVYVCVNVMSPRKCFSLYCLQWLWETTHFVLAKKDVSLHELNSIK